MIVSLTIVLAAFFLTASTKEVPGQADRAMLILGWQAPKWAFAAGGAAAFFLVHGLVYRVLGRWFPAETPGAGEGETMSGKLYPLHGGGSILSQMEDPEARTPLDYEVPNLTPESSAEEFLQAGEPNSMRVMVLGIEEHHREWAFHHEMEQRWIAEAPEEALRDLLPEVERLLETCDAFPYEWVYKLLDASRVRGIPTTEELSEFAERLNVEGLRRLLRGEEWDPMVDPW